LQDGVEVGAQPRVERAVAVDRPGDERAVAHGANRPGQGRGVGRGQLASRDGPVEQRPHLILHRARVDGGQPAELRIGEIKLEERDVVGQLVAGERRRAADQHRVQGGERRAVLGAGGARLLGGVRGGLFDDREQQTPLRAEPLHQGGGGEPGLAGDLGQREPPGPHPAHDPAGRRADRAVAGGAWPWQHFSCWLREGALCRRRRRAPHARAPPGVSPGFRHRRAFASLTGAVRCGAFGAYAPDCPARASARGRRATGLRPARRKPRVVRRLRRPGRMSVGSLWAGSPPL
jgi:hypothetical protein